MRVFGVYVAEGWFLTRPFSSIFANQKTEKFSIFFRQMWVNFKSSTHNSVQTLRLIYRLKPSGEHIQGEEINQIKHRQESFAGVIKCMTFLWNVYIWWKLMARENKIMPNPKPSNSLKQFPIFGLGHRMGGCHKRVFNLLIILPA